MSAELKRLKRTDFKDTLSFTLNKGVALVLSQRTMAVSPIHQLTILVTILFIICFLLTRDYLFIWIVAPIIFGVIVLYIVLLFKKSQLLMSEDHIAAMAKMLMGDERHGLLDKISDTYLASEDDENEIKKIKDSTK